MIPRTARKHAEKVPIVQVRAAIDPTLHSHNTCNSIYSTQLEVPPPPKLKRDDALPCGGSHRSRHLCLRIFLHGLP